MRKIISKIGFIILTLVLGVVMLFGSACKPNYPESRSFIVTNRKSFERIIIDDFEEFEVDFDKEMLVVYTFTAMYVLPAKIADIEFNDKTLTVNYTIELIPMAGSACTPFQRWFIVKLDKLDITSVKNSVSEEYKDAEQDVTEENSAYNATLYDNCGAWIKENFQTKNRVKGAHYYSL